ncbi:hypothetical protein ACFX13_010248 [Malus domestica]
MLERPRRCCEGTAMGAIILYFQYSLEIGNQTGRRELTAALVMAKGYKSFSYAVPLKEVVPGTLVALPVAEEEAFTGVLDSGKGQMNAVAEGLKEFSRDDLLKLMAKCERWAEEILNLQNKLLQTELERERMALELEEKKAQAEREKMVQQQAKKIENLRSMVLYSNRDRITIALKRFA